VEVPLTSLGHLSEEYFMTFKTHILTRAIKKTQLINLLAGQRIASERARHWITVIKLITTSRHHLRHSSISKESQKLYIVPCYKFLKKCLALCPWRAGKPAR
jgi:hypothetical protein